MTDKQWQIFCNFKKEFSKKIEEWQNSAPELPELQKNAALAAKTPLYPFETAVVYNRDLDKLTKDDQIRLIVIGDNPGKDEQLAKNNRYLVGQAGKIADGFFKRNPELQVDFRKNVIILNKTPVHSAKTAQLKNMMKAGGPKIVKLIQESQLWMAEKTAELHSELCNAATEAIKNGEDSAIAPELWLVGYSELKEKGFFVPYKNQLKEGYKNFAQKSGKNFWSQVYVFQHFSMNRFTIDLSDFMQRKGKADINLDNIHQLGNIHKTEIFGE